MQIIQCSRDELLKPLQTVVGIIEKKESNPILANVHLHIHGNQVEFTGTDAEIFIRSSAAVGSADGEVMTTTLARKFVEILRSLPPGPVTIHQDGARLTIQSGRSRFTVQTLPADDYPMVVVDPDPLSVVTLPQRSLRKLLHMAAFATAQNDVRYYLNGVLMQFGEEGMHAVGTDTHRLAWYQLPEVSTTVPAEVILPRKTVLELLRQLPESDDPVELAVFGQRVRVRFGTIDLVSKLIEGRYPDYRRVIPAGNERVVEVGREVLASALHRVAVLSNEKFRGVRLTLQDGVMQLQCRNVEHEEALEELEVPYTGEPLDIAFNISFLLDVLGILKGETVRLAFGEATSSALLTVPDDPSFRYVIMPMRL